MVVNNSANLRLVSNISNNALRYLPEPATRGVGLFNDVIKRAAGIAEAATGGIGTSATADFRDLLNMQIQAQKEMQQTTMVSNVEKSKHETRMGPIRNIRVS